MKGLKRSLTFVLLLALCSMFGGCGVVETVRNGLASIGSFHPPVQSVTDGTTTTYETTTTSTTTTTNGTTTP